MFELKQIVAERDADLAVEVHALQNALQPLAAAPVAPENAGFQLPRGVWKAMFACYGIFFAAIFAATGGSGPARFAIVISVLYTFVYFGVARICARQAGKEAQSPLDRGKMLETWTGLMDGKAVSMQVLIVPFGIALFGIGILIITLSIGTGAPS